MRILVGNARGAGPGSAAGGRAATARSAATQPGAGGALSAGDSSRRRRATSSTRRSPTCPCSSTKRRRRSSTSIRTTPPCAASRPAIPCAYSTIAARLVATARVTDRARPGVVVAPSSLVAQARAGRRERQCRHEPGADRSQARRDVLRLPGGSNAGVAAYASFAALRSILCAGKPARKARRPSRFFAQKPRMARRVGRRSLAARSRARTSRRLYLGTQRSARRCATGSDRNLATLNYIFRTSPTMHAEDLQRAFGPDDRIGLVLGSSE